MRGKTMSKRLTYDQLSFLHEWVGTYDGAEGDDNNDLARAIVEWADEQMTARENAKARADIARAVKAEGRRLDIASDDPRVAAVIESQYDEWARRNNR